MPVVECACVQVRVSLCACVRVRASGGGGKKIKQAYVCTFVRMYVECVCPRFSSMWHLGISYS